MTVPSENSRATYTGNGVATVFPTGFYFRRADQLRVRYITAPPAETVLTLGVHYTVTMPAGVGVQGSITMLTPPANASTLIVERDVLFTQATSFRSQLSFDRATHEDAFDETVFRDQELVRRVADLEAKSAPSSGLAGNGLFITGSTWHVGAGTGIVVGADTVGVDFGAAGADISAAAAVAGSTSKVSDAGHTHRVVTGGVNPLEAGGAGDPGSGAALALASHVHALPLADVSDLTAISVSNGNVGGSGFVADAGHSHNVLVAAPVELTDSANGEGNSDELARANHQHAHGNRGGGPLHAPATTTENGFFEATDKVILNALAAARTHVSVRRSSAQSIPHETNTKVIFNAAVYDARNEFDLSSGEFEAIDAGYYLVSFALRLNGTQSETDGNNTITAALLSSTLSREWRGWWDNGAYADPMAVSGTVTMKLAAGEKLHLEVEQENTSGDPRGLASGHICWMTIDRID